MADWKNTGSFVLQYRGWPVQWDFQKKAKCLFRRPNGDIQDPLEIRIVADGRVARIPHSIKAVEQPGGAPVLYEYEGALYAELEPVVLRSTRDFLSKAIDVYLDVLEMPEAKGSDEL